MELSTVIEIVTDESSETSEVTYTMTDEFGHPIYGYPVQS